jgi:hypothetical protein
MENAHQLGLGAEQYDLVSLQANGETVRDAGVGG